MRKSRGPLFELTVARLKEFVREPEAMFWVFAFPIILALALGFAFRERGPEKIPIGIVAESGDAAILQHLVRSPALLPRIFSRQEAFERLHAGKVSLLVEKDVNGYTYHFDETRPDSRIARLETDDVLQQAAGRKTAVPVQQILVTEKGSRYIDFLIPGLLGMNLMGTGMWGIGFSVVTARTKKLLKRLVATPMRKSDYLLAQMLSRLVFLVVEVTILLLFGRLVFGVPMRGSIFTLALICLLGAVAFSGLGLLIASRARTIEAVSGLMNITMMPMWILSGVFFSSERFPDALQPVIRALPLTALNESLRAVMLEGAGLPMIASQLLILSAWTLVSFSIALRIFRWK